MSRFIDAASFAAAAAAVFDVEGITASDWDALLKLGRRRLSTAEWKPFKVDARTDWWYPLYVDSDVPRPAIIRLSNYTFISDANIAYTPRPRKKL